MCAMCVLCAMCAMCLLDAKLVQELTEQSIKESDDIVDQAKRAEVAQESVLGESPEARLPRGPPSLPQIFPNPLKSMGISRGFPRGRHI